MKLDFLYETDWQKKELAAITRAELSMHFLDTQYSDFNCETVVQDGAVAVHIEIDNGAFMADIEKSKGRLRGKGYMTDFVSEVQENLSFVPAYIAS